MNARRFHKLPRHLALMLSALNLRRANTRQFHGLSDQHWTDFLRFTDDARLTLHLAACCRESFPDWVRERTDRNLADNRERFRRLMQAYEGLAVAFREAGVEHVVLKGFTHWPDFVAEPRRRLQSDIDLFCPAEMCAKASAVVASVGYRPVPTSASADHLPIMIRETGWSWKGNLYDPEIPAHVEIHRRLWDGERFRLPLDLQPFWKRRTLRQFEAQQFPALQWQDTLGFAALQVLRDLLDHGLSAHKLYEVAHFLHVNAANESYWREWGTLHPAEMRRAECVAFRLAVECFDCDVPDQLDQEFRELPPAVEQWIATYSAAVLDPMRKMNKDAVWLHAALIQSAREKAKVICRGLIPLKLRVNPETYMVGDTGVVPERSQAKRRLHYVAHSLRRLPLHASLIPITLWHGARLYCQSNSQQTRSPAPFTPL